jgi:phosphoglycolate phosphatase
LQTTAPSPQVPKSLSPLSARPFRLIVFDLDGTLVDSRRDIAEAANLVLASYGASPLDEDRIGRMVGDGAAMLIARAFAARGMTAPPDALDCFVKKYATCLLAHTRPYPGIPDVLAALSGRARLAVLTNKPLRPTREILAGLDLAGYFSDDAVIGGDGPFDRKPDPAGLQYIQTKAQVTPADTLFVGDSPIDWQTAKAAGTPICLARYGFGFQGFTAGMLGQDDMVIDAPGELLELS